MPIYEYRCPECDTVFDELKKVADRKTHDCPQCGATANVLVSRTHLDYRMGVSYDFPTAAAKWDKIQRSKNQKGGTWDSNNNRYGGEHEK